MKLDGTFLHEIRALCVGKMPWDLRKWSSEVAEALSHRYQFQETFSKYGRAKVGVCVAYTMLNNHGYETQQLAWARAVMESIGSDIKGLFSANIHPALLAENSSTLRNTTTLEAL